MGNVLCLSLCAVPVGAQYLSLVTAMLLCLCYVQVTKVPELVLQELSQ